MLDIISIFLNWLRLALWPSMWSTLENYWYVCSYCLSTNCFGYMFVGLFSSLPLLFSPFVVWWLTLVLCLDSFLFFVCVSIVDFHFAITMRIWYSSLYISKIILICWSFNFKCISSILHLCSPLLTIADFDIMFVCRWFPAFTLYLPLLVSFSIHNFLVSSSGLSFSA